MALFKFVLNLKEWLPIALARLPVTKALSKCISPCGEPTLEYKHHE